MLSLNLLVSPPVIASGLVLILVTVAVTAYVLRAQRATRSSVVLCPPVAMPGNVSVDGYLRVQTCSRLPEGQSCNQDCVAQLAYSSHDLNDFLQQHGGQKCASCFNEISADDWYKSRLSGSKGVLDATSAKFTHEPDVPICWDCFSLLNKHQSA